MKMFAASVIYFFLTVRNEHIRKLICKIDVNWLDFREQTPGRKVKMLTVLSHDCQHG